MKKFYDKYSWLIIILLVLALVFLKNCSPEKTKPKNPINLKPEIKAQDNQKKDVKQKDSIQIKEVHHWHVIKEKAQKDTTPCGTEIRYIVAECDTVLMADSALILSLKKLVAIDSVIQKKQTEIIEQKTDSIHDLTKKLKWSKLKTKGIIAIWLAREAVGVGSKIKN